MTKKAKNIIQFVTLHIVVCICIVSMLSTQCQGALFLDKDTSVMSYRGVLVYMHIVSTTATTQISTIKGYYGKDGRLALQYATDTITVRIGVTGVPKLSSGVHLWHKTNDSLSQDYSYYSSTGVTYRGTFIQYGGGSVGGVNGGSGLASAFSVYIDNFVELDTINAWSFFNTYSYMCSRIGSMYQSRILASTSLRHTILVLHVTPEKNISVCYAVNGRKLSSFTARGMVKVIANKYGCGYKTAVYNRR